MDMASSQSSGGVSNLGNKRLRIASSQGLITVDHANPSLGINELLCYTMKKFNQLKAKMLKQVVLDFYDSTQTTLTLTTAKEV